MTRRNFARAATLPGSRDSGRYVPWPVGEIYISYIQRCTGRGRVCARDGPFAPFDTSSPSTYHVVVLCALKRERLCRRRRRRRRRRADHSVFLSSLAVSQSGGGDGRARSITGERERERVLFEKRRPGFTDRSLVGVALCVVHSTRAYRPIHGLGPARPRGGLRA